MATRPQDLLSPVWSRYSEIVAERGEGAYIYDPDGNRYLDFTTGIAVTSTGHCHPRVVKAIQEQAARLIHGQANIVYHPPMLRLVEELRRIMPPELDSFFFSNSGAEAVEGAVKLARHATGRPNVIAFQGSFHGRTAMTMSLTSSKTIYRAGYQPLTPGVFFAPYPYAYRYGWDEKETAAWCLDELRYVLRTQTAPFETAAILVEPVLGEGGYVPPPPSFLKGLREVCDEHGILLIVDEIQSGFGRTGKWFAFQHFGIVPDVVTMAKGIASGMPLSGIAARRELMEKWIVGSHGGTYGGNAISCAAAVATIQVIRDEGLVENAAMMGSLLMERLRDVQSRFPVIGDVRGLGLMVATEFSIPDSAPYEGAAHTPDTATAKAVVQKCKDEHLLLLTCGPWDNTIRWIPPLIVTEEQIDAAVAIFENALREVVG